MQNVHRFGGVLTGWAIGAAAGLLDASLAASRVLAPAPDVHAWGVIIDGGVGAVVGLAATFVLPRLPRAVPIVAGVLGVLATVAGLAQATQAAEDVPLPVREHGRLRPSALWVQVQGLTEDAGLDPDRPVLAELSKGALAFSSVVATGVTPVTALAGTLTARREEGRGAAAFTVGDAIAWTGLASVAVVLHDDGALIPVLHDVDRVVPVVGDARRGRATRQLGLVRLLGLSDDDPVATVDDVVDAALDAVAGAGGPVGLVVELPPGTPSAQDAALARLVAAVGDRAPVLVSGLPAAGADDGPRLGRARLVAPAWLTVPQGPLRGQHIASDLSAIELAPQWVQQVEPLAVSPFDAHLGAPDNVARGLAARVHPRKLAAYDGGGGVEGPSACVLAHGVTPDEVASITRDGDDVAVRRSGYAWVREQGQDALYDEVVDPFWTRDLLAADAPTCDDLSARARVASMEGLLDTLGKASRDKATTPGPDPVLPDPDAAFFPPAPPPPG